MNTAARYFLIAALLLGAGRFAHAAATDALWSSRPYRIAIDLDFQGSGLSTAQQARLRRDLVETIHNRLGRFWRVALDGAPLAGLGDEDALPFDKRLTCELEAAAGTLRMRVREHDLALDQHSLPRTGEAVELAGAPGELFDTIMATFRPIARFLRDPQTPGRVTLAYRAADLAPASGLGFAREGELLAPYKRKLSRDGTPIADSVKPVKWTYLVVEPRGEGTPGATVVSHSRRALAGRGGGRTEQLALLAPSDPDLTTELYLHTSGDNPEPLPGYEVLVGDASRAKLVSLGYSDAEGRVRVPSGERVLFAHARCGNTFVASVPVAPGVDEVIDLPLIDERSRLRAELEVTNLRERLIDTVARRKILGQRIKRAVEQEKIDLAKTLLDELEELPGRTQFNRQLDQTERGVRAPHPAAQKRLDSMFTLTRQLVNAALDPRELRTIASVVIDAQQTSQNAAASAAEQTPNG